jgi:proline iminopeptidase
MALEFRDGFVRALGNRLYWNSIGIPEKGTILFLHGLGVDHHIGRNYADLAQFGYRVVTYDRRGVGRSQRPRSSRDFSLRREAEEVEAVRRGLRLGRCHLVGYSWGGNLVLESALRYPRSFRSLVVSNASASRPEFLAECNRLVARLPKSAQHAIELVDVQGRPAGRAYREAWAEFNRRHAGDERVMPIDAVLAFQGSNPKVVTAVEQANKEWDVRDQLGRIRLPTLVTTGIRDFCTPRLARTISRGIPRSKLVIFRKSGHNCLNRERDLYLDVIRRFLDPL